MVVKWFFILVFCLLSVAISSDDGTEQLKTFMTNLVSFKSIPEDLSKVNISNGDASFNRKLAQKTINFVNIHTISQRALGKNIWKKIGKNQQNKFVSTLRRLVVLNAFPRSYVFLKKVTFSYKTIDAKKNKSKIRQTVIVKGDEENPEDTEMLIDYTLEKKKKWSIVDVAFDNISLLETYSNQFRALIRKKKFKGLLSMMLTKQKEMEKDYGKLIPK